MNSSIRDYFHPNSGWNLLPAPTLPHSHKLFPTTVSFPNPISFLNYIQPSQTISNLSYALATRYSHPCLIVEQYSLNPVSFIGYSYPPPTSLPFPDVAASFMAKS